MVIINADDWGRSRKETDHTLQCYKAGRITAVSAMVFMEDSERAAKIAIDENIEVGLHLNFDQNFTSTSTPKNLHNDHEKVCRYLSIHKYARIIYNPFLRLNFRRDYNAQFAEFRRLFKKEPSHINGHHHLHLCANMIIEKIFPENATVRRNFTFTPEDKFFLNRYYRKIIDYSLAKRYRLTDQFYSLYTCIKNEKIKFVAEKAKTSDVEIMCHPVNELEFEYLMSDEFSPILEVLEKEPHTAIENSESILLQGS